MLTINDYNTTATDLVRESFERNSRALSARPQDLQPSVAGILTGWTEALAQAVEMDLLSVHEATELTRAAAKITVAVDDTHREATKQDQEPVMGKDEFGNWIA